MNRRYFCKLAISSGLMAAFAPSKALASVSSMMMPWAKVCITVVRCECYGDLQSCWGADPEAGPCHILHPGMSWTASSSGGMPQGMCPKAWRAIESSLADCGEGCRLSRQSLLVACPDGSRPVIFKVSPIP